MATVVAAQPAANLLSLPRELRDQIYGYLPEGHQHWWTYSSLATKKAVNGTHRQEAILDPILQTELHLVCRQLCTELFEFFFHKAELKLKLVVIPTRDWAFEKVLKNVPKQVLMRVQTCNLELRWNSDIDKHHRPVRFLERHLSSLRQSLPELKNVTCNLFYPSPELFSHDIAEKVINVNNYFAMQDHVSGFGKMDMHLFLRTPCASAMVDRFLTPPFMPEHHLTQHTDVFWKLTPTKDPVSYHGFFPELQWFHHTNGTATTAEELEDLIEEACQEAEIDMFIELNGAPSDEVHADEHDDDAWTDDSESQDGDPESRQGAINHSNNATALGDDRGQRVGRSAVSLVENGDGTTGAGHNGTDGPPLASLPSTNMAERFTSTMNVMQAMNSGRRPENRDLDILFGADPSRDYADLDRMIGTSVGEEDDDESELDEEDHEGHAPFSEVEEAMTSEPSSDVEAEVD